MSNDFNEYADLGATGYKSSEATKPEDDFFHSLYISGQSRKNHIDIVETAGKLQIRGVEYNLDKIHMIITHVKKVLVKSGKDAQGKDRVECFSFKKTPQPPWFGWENRPCGSNSAERSAIAFCNTCREQIIMAGLYCNEAGNPILHAETKAPLFAFLRGKGMKYNSVSQFLADCYKEDIVSPLFTPVTAETTEFEKIAVNNKRCVTVIGMGKAPSAFGEKDIFTFAKGTPLDNKTIFSILGIAKKSLDKFNEKFDWSKPINSGAPSGYVQPQVNQTNIIPDSNVGKESQPSTQQQAPPVTAQPTFNFEDISF